MPRLPRRLTKSIIDSLVAAPGEAQTFYWDSELTGFGLRVSSHGHKSFVVKRRNHRMVLDRVGVVSLEEARQRAIEFMAQVGRGEDPVEARRQGAQQARQRAKSDLSVREVWQAYTTAKKQLRDRTRVEYGYALQTYCSDWIDHPIRSLTREFISDEHTRIRAVVARRRASRLATGNSTANGVMRVVRALWNFAAEQELVPDLGRNPVGSLSVNRAWYPEVVREDFVPAADLPVFYGAVMDYRSPRLSDSTALRDLVRLMLFTGLRLNEARCLRWKNIDERRGLIRLSAEETKAKRRLDLPISPYVAGLLAGRPRTHDWVFPGERSHVVDPRPVLRQAASRISSMHDSHGGSSTYYSPHSLRRTFVTVAESLNLSAYTLKALVNHSFGSDVTAGYIGRDIERLREGMSQVADRLLVLIDGDPSTRSSPLVVPSARSPELGDSRLVVRLVTAG
jgi:integrase